VLKMAIGQTEEADGLLAAREVLAEAIPGLGGQPPGAAILFANHDLEFDAFFDEIFSAYPDLPLIGCTAVAPVSSAAPHVEGATTLTLFASDVIDFSVGLATGVSADVGLAARRAVADAMAATDKPAALVIITPTAEGFDPAAITDEMGKALGPGIPVFGGGAVPDYPITGNFEGGLQIFGREVLTDALPLLLLSGPLTVSVGVRHGWQPVGRDAVITRSKGNRVYEIDGKPVIDYYRHYIGPTSEPAASTPLAIMDLESGRQYLRSPLYWDAEEGSADFFGSVPEGSIVRVSIASTEDILEGARLSVADALAGYPAGKVPEAGLVSVCATRNILLGTRTSEEVETIKESLGPGLPISGFYAFGEIAPLDLARTPRFHNETCVTLLLGT
jgi:hypothetical protein